MPTLIAAAMLTFAATAVDSSPVEQNSTPTVAETIESAPASNDAPILEDRIDVTKF
jgi:hypothetical protein